MSLLSAGAFVQLVLLRHCRYPVIRHHLFVFNMIRRAAGKINVGFLTTILILMGWGDWKLPVRFIIGFQAVGPLEDTHIWSATEIARPESEADLLALFRGTVLRHILSSCKRVGQVVQMQYNADASSGICSSIHTQAVAVVDRMSVWRTTFRLCRCPLPTLKVAGN